MKRLFSILGIELKPVSHAERIASTVGGIVSIYCIYVVCQWLVGYPASAVIIASMGSSAVLLFAVPHGPLSQPWAVFGGHLVSALTGVACAQIFSNPMIAASLAVGLSIGAMYYLRCIHPPGGATALGAVVGSDATHALGFQFVLTPVMLNVVIIIAVGVIFNYMFPWRRYPIYLYRLMKQKESDGLQPQPASISHEDFVYALSEIDSFVDVSEDDLIRIYDIATKKSQEPSIDPGSLVIGGYYSNGAYGEDWSVRQIVDESLSEDPEKDIIVYKTVAGKGRRGSGYSSRNEFLRWAKYPVIRDEENWKRLEED